MRSFPVRSGQTFLLIGDSITDCGRRDRAAPYGDGYASLFRELVTVKHPERNIRWLNRGIGGNTVRDLRNRWTDDVVREKPDWLTIKIGINDVHRTLAKTAESVPADQFRTLYDEILVRTRRETKAKIVLIDPFYYSADTETDSQRTKVLALLRDYLGIVKELAAKYKLPRLNTHDLVQTQLKYRSVGEFCPEPVHPYRIGHMLIAMNLYDLIATQKR
jgi:lysophospholipase L1-like esterase